MSPRGISAPSGPKTATTTDGVPNSFAIKEVVKAVSTAGNSSERRVFGDKKELSSAEAAWGRQQKDGKGNRKKARVHVEDGRRHDNGDAGGGHGRDKPRSSAPQPSALEGASDKHHHPSAATRPQSTPTPPGAARYRQGGTDTASEREHGSTHSLQVAESPGMLADAGSVRWGTLSSLACIQLAGPQHDSTMPCSQSCFYPCRLSPWHDDNELDTLVHAAQLVEGLHASTHATQLGDPDPLARWFAVHIAALAAAGG